MKIPIKDWIHRRSILVKVLMIVLVADILVNLIVISYLSLVVRAPGKTVLKLVREHMEIILDELGSPPQYENAIAVRQRLGLFMRYDGKNDSWKMHDKFPPIKDISFRPIDSDFGIRLGRYKMLHFIIVKNNDDYFAIIPEAAFEQTFEDLRFFLLIVSLSLIFLVVYFTLRRVFLPLHFLKKGVQQVEFGNYDYRLPEDRTDELGELSRAFNTMSLAVKENVHSREQLMLNVSHELRSPLTRMKIALEMMDECDNKSHLDEDVRQMESMLTELLESARLGSGYGRIEKQTYNICQLISDICLFFSERQTKIECNLPNDSLIVLIDPDRIAIVIKNLLENALKYSIDKTKPIRLTLEKKFQWAVITIRDYGDGIPEKDIPYIFEPFYRVDKSRSKKTGGYGLGLSLCKKIIAFHQGKIDLQSWLGQGTEITIELPLDS